jgi:hypothetical protein
VTEMHKREEIDKLAAILKEGVKEK